MDYFELYDIPVSLKVDKKMLAKKYFELQRKYHPDLNVSSEEDEKAEALEMSSIINKALKVLQNEDETIKYVLQLKGLLQEEEKYQLPADFLMEMMELNEETDAPELKAEKYVSGLYDEIKSIIEHYKDGVTTTEDLLKVKEYYYKKKYLQRILDRTQG